MQELFGNSQTGIKVAKAEVTDMKSSVLLKPLKHLILRAIDTYLYTISSGRS